MYFVCISQCSYLCVHIVHVVSNHYMMKRIVVCSYLVSCVWATAGSNIITPFRYSIGWSMENEYPGVSNSEEAYFHIANILGSSSLRGGVSTCLPLLNLWIGRPEWYIANAAEIRRVGECVWGLEGGEDDEILNQILKSLKIPLLSESTLAFVANGPSSPVVEQSGTFAQYIGTNFVDESVNVPSFFGLRASTIRYLELMITSGFTHELNVHLLDLADWLFEQNFDEIAVWIYTISVFRIENLDEKIHTYESLKKIGWDFVGASTGHHAGMGAGRRWWVAKVGYMLEELTENNWDVFAQCFQPEWAIERPHTTQIPYTSDSFVGTMQSSYMSTTITAGDLEEFVKGTTEGRETTDGQYKRTILGAYSGTSERPYTRTTEGPSMWRMTGEYWQGTSPVYVGETTESAYTGTAGVGTTEHPYMEITEGAYTETTEGPYTETTERAYTETTESAYMETTQHPYSGTTETPSSSDDKSNVSGGPSAGDYYFWFEDATSAQIAKTYMCFIKGIEATKAQVKRSTLFHLIRIATWSQK